MDKNKLKKVLQGKRLSILGDSISTYSGYSDNPEYNSSIGVNAVYYTPEKMAVGDTYWMQLICSTGLKLCVNNSWSGGYLTRHAPNVGHDAGGKISCGCSRAHQLANNSGAKPDIILVFLGINDLRAGVEISRFASSCRNTYAIIGAMYRDSDVFVLGMPDRKCDNAELLNSYNKAIKASAEEKGNKFSYIDFASGAYSGEVYLKNSIDGLHPNKNGMKLLSEMIAENLNERYVNI